MIKLHLNNQEIVKLARSLNIQYSQSHKRLTGACPVHNGDNPTGFSISLKTGHWACYTEQCHRKFGYHLVGLVQAIKKNSSKDALAYIKEVVGNHVLENKIIVKDDKSLFIEAIEAWTDGLDSPKPVGFGQSRQWIRNQLLIPATYYLERGYSKEILDKYDVGWPKVQPRQLKYRVIVPVYDSNLVYIGCSGRSIYEKCLTCDGFHPKNKQCVKNPKWQHILGFNRFNALYNIWYAKEFILKSKEVVIVESPGNVWRLEEAGFHNSVATFGTELTQSQAEFLKECGVKHIINLADNDKGGMIGTDIIRARCEKWATITTPDIEHNDIGLMSVLDVQSLMRSI